jgi:lipopolysaccharide export system protein LptA
MRHLKFLVLALLFGVTGTVHALANDKDQPVQLSADSVDMDEGKEISVYKGDVDLRQGSMRLQADQVTIQHRGQQPEKVIATGSPVRFQQDSGNGLVKARAQRAEYEVNSEVLVLIGKASLTRAGNTTRSDRIVYDRVRHQVKAGAAAQGKQRVQITIEPGKPNK